MLYLQPVQILSLHREIITRYNRLLDTNYKVTITTDVYVRISVNKVDFASKIQSSALRRSFSEEGLFRSRFSKSSVKFKGKWKVRVPSHASVSKYYADKTYANLWFILLQVTKGFRFQKNKTVRFISGNFSSDRFL